MSELAARIADGWAPPPSEIELAALVVVHKHLEITAHVSLAGHVPGEFGEACPDCSAMLTYIRKLLAEIEPRIVAARDRELAEAGRLLPEVSAESDKAGPND